MLHCPEPTKERVEPTTIGMPAIEIPNLTRLNYAITDTYSMLNVRNHHATTILNFLVVQLAAMMNLIQFDFHKSRNCSLQFFCYALRMITVVIETFARCQLYRLLWP